jgi:hypothetical protein
MISLSSTIEILSTVNDFDSRRFFRSRTRSTLEIFSAGEILRITTRTKVFETSLRINGYLRHCLDDSVRKLALRTACSAVALFLGVMSVFRRMPLNHWLAVSLALAEALFLVLGILLRLNLEPVLVVYCVSYFVATVLLSIVFPIESRSFNRQKREQSQ